METPTIMGSIEISRTRPALLKQNQNVGPGDEATVLLC